jgi:hypothetical protein
MKEAPCKISASHLFAIAQTPSDTRVLLSQILKPEKILTLKNSKDSKVIIIFIKKKPLP